LDKLWKIVELPLVVELLLEGRPLEPINRLHQLSGNWSGYWECHIEPDWLLVREQNDEWQTLVRTGTHADLFG
jgi:mRNA interferase YafQ